VLWALCFSIISNCSLLPAPFRSILASKIVSFGRKLRRFSNAISDFSSAFETLSARSQWVGNWEINKKKKTICEIKSNINKEITQLTRLI
jgi:hypothetical protein